MKLITKQKIKGEDVPVTTSLKVAEYFGKLHKNVVRDIEKLMDSNELKSEPVNYFTLSEYKDKKGERRKQYLLTQGGFTLLAMGFTGDSLMNFMITKQMIDGAEINSVDARELWERLEVKSNFTTWMTRRIEDSMFVEGQDFIPLLEESTGGRPEKTYIVSLEMAKHLAMMEKTGKGFEVRQYFIDAEKQLRVVLESKPKAPALPTTYLEALEELVAKERLLLEQAPTVQAFQNIGVH